MSVIDTPENEKICPFMSGRPVPVAVPGIVEQPGAQAFTVTKISCSKDKCALWVNDSCSLGQASLTAVVSNVAVGLVEVADGLALFNPPSSGSPTTRLVEAIEGLIETLRDRKTVTRKPN